MGQKGNIKMDSNSLLDAASVVKATASAVDNSRAEIKRLMDELKDTNILNGGKPAEDINAGVSAVENAMERVSAVSEKVSKFIDDLTVRVETNLQGSRAGASARNAGEDAKRKVQNIQN